MAFSNINPKSDYEFSKILNKFVTPSEPITTPERLFGREDELKRALKEDGYIVHVTANNQHLIEIKELIYDEIKVKSDKYIRLDFNQVKSYDFKEKVHISNREDALNLLMMTPHYYHIKKEKRGVLDTLQGLDITIDIKVTVYALS